MWGVVAEGWRQFHLQARWDAGGGGRDSLVVLCCTAWAQGVQMADLLSEQAQQQQSSRHSWSQPSHLLSK